VQLAQPDEIFERIFQGPLEARPWQALLDCVRGRLPCDAAAISLRPSKIGLAPKTIWSRSDSASDAELEQIVLQVAALGRANPVGEALKASGEILRLSDILSPQEIANHPYCKLMMESFDLKYQIGMRIVERAGWIAHLGFFNRADKGDFGDDCVRFLKTICPHMERSLEIYARLKRSESEKRIFEDSLDRLMIGAFILDGSGKVIETNRIGELILLNKSILSIVGGQLCMAKSADNQKFRSVVATALSSRAQGEQSPFVDAIRLEHLPDNIGILVRSVQSIDSYASSSMPWVVVYVSGWPKPTGSTPHAFISELFGLTPAEAKLALLLSNGTTIPDAAQQLGITEISARTNLKRIFAKTGISRQVDLVRLILRSVAILA
jgi:DNA-binding CsgD family transcriptional regulator